MTKNMENRKLRAIDIKEMKSYPMLPEELKYVALQLSAKMLKAAGHATPKQLGAASALCLELAMFLQNDEKTRQ